MVKLEITNQTFGCELNDMNYWFPQISFWYEKIATNVESWVRASKTKNK